MTFILFQYFIYLYFGCSASSQLHRLSLVWVSGGCSLVVVCGLLIAVAFLVGGGLLIAVAFLVG